MNPVDIDPFQWGCLTPKTTEIEYPCICKHEFLQKGCTCGAMAAYKSDKEAQKRVAEQEKRDVLKKHEDFFIGPPTPPITFRTLPECGQCKHPNHKPMCCEKTSCLCLGDH
jgi:hypothetical protein